jgi:hypothetical protein
MSRSIPAFPSKQSMNVYDAFTLHSLLTSYARTEGVGMFVFCRRRAIVLISHIIEVLGEADATSGGGRSLAIHLTRSSNSMIRTMWLWPRPISGRRAHLIPFRSSLARLSSASQCKDSRNDSARERSDPSGRDEKYVHR